MKATNLTSVSKLAASCGNFTFGVTNGVPHFQRVVDILVNEDGLKGTFPYLDNVTVGGNCQGEHDKNVSQFLQSIRKRGLVLN